MRFGLYYSGGLDSTFNDRPIGSVADSIAAVPRGDYPAYADSQVRELIERYQPSVLWNDIAWPSTGDKLWPLLEHYYEQVPDGVVNDRWMPWSPLLATTRTELARRGIDAVLQKQAQKDAGLIPPRPPYFDYRTPEYVVFDDVQSQPWECVRGMDKSFGYNAQSRSEDFLPRDELLWMVADITAKGGNLLLNVGPRGIDAQIPDEQLTRLEWLADWVRPHAQAIHASRPWITPGSTTSDGHQLRYTARDDSVYAVVREPVDTIKLPDVTSTPTTVVATVDGTGLPWKDTRESLDIDAAAARNDPDPTVVVLKGVSARS
jgi:alpha-L-fucosidase